MAINWGLLGNQQGQFQNALAMGAQIGSAAAERKNQEGYRNALMNYDPSNPDSAKEVMRFSPEVGFKLQQQAAAQQQAAQQQRMEAMPVVSNMLKAARANPENYAAILNRARELGIPGVENAPAEYDPAWIDREIQLTSMLQSPVGQEILSTAGKQAYDEGLRPGDGRYEGRVREIFEIESRKTVPFQPGGGVLEYNPATGELQILAAPSGAPGSVVVPPPPEGFTLDGDVSGNAGSGF